MAQIEKSTSYRGETVLDRDIWNQCVSAYIGQYTVEINSARWSGRQTKEDAITGIDELIEFLQETRREIVKSMPQAPKYPAGKFTKIRTGMFDRYPVDLTDKGREWNRLDRERHALDMLQRDADKSWRAEIVAEECHKDKEYLKRENRHGA